MDSNNHVSICLEKLKTYTCLPHRETSLSPPVKIVLLNVPRLFVMVSCLFNAAKALDHVFFVDHFCYLCFVFVMVSCLFNAAKALTSWLSCVMCLSRV